MNEQALIIFARKPERGKVKTRLAAQIGDEAALNIYIRLLEHTREVARTCDCDTHIFLTEISADDFWDGFALHTQADGDLGHKMQDAFWRLFEAGYKSVVIIGSDCPALNASDVQLAFQALEAADLVLGPAVDGGYYLLGMKRLHVSFFRGKSWSGEQVFAETIADINRDGLSYSLLRMLSDVDEKGDVPLEWR